jgi:hypothetical protein
LFEIVINREKKQSFGRNLMVDKVWKLGKINKVWKSNLIGGNKLVKEGLIGGNKLVKLDK